jgi:hypothetical protein
VTEQNEQGRSRREHPWLIAIIAPAIAAILAAGAIGIWKGIISSGPPSPSPTPSSPGPSSGGSSSLSASRTVTASSSPLIYYQGPVTISGNGLDFDINPPSHGPATANFVYNTSALQGAGSNTVGFAVWKQGGTPMASDCNTFVTTNSTSVVINVAAGMKICFKTDQGRVGLLSVQPDTTPNELHAIATVWTPAA